MGRDKANLPHPDGGTLLERQLTLINELAPAEKFVSLRHEQADPTSLPTDWRVVRDTGEAGPLGGIVATLQVCTAPRLLVLAVDLPAMDVPTLRNLLVFAPTGGVVPRSDHGFEPLAAIYPHAWLPTALAALRTRQLSLQRLLDTAVTGGAFQVVPAVPGAIWTNWNEPGDLPASAS